MARPRKPTPLSVQQMLAELPEPARTTWALHLEVARLKEELFWLMHSWRGKNHTQRNRQERQR